MITQAARARSLNDGCPVLFPVLLSREDVANLCIANVGLCRPAALVSDTRVCSRFKQQFDNGYGFFQFSGGSWRS